MAQLTVNNADIIQKLKTDQQFRSTFLSNSSKTMSDLGMNIDEKTLGGILDKQLGQAGPSQAMSTAIIITIF